MSMTEVRMPLTPGTVARASNVLSAGGAHTCATTSEGKVKCWGHGINGELGNDGTVNKDHPVSVVDGDGSSTDLAGIVQVASGGYHTCAVTSGGEIKCWGSGANGRLGNDASTDKDHPVSVVDGDGSSTALTGIVQVGLGEDHSCALTSGGEVKCWGFGRYGRLGNDGTANKDHPVSVVDGDGSSTALKGIAQIGLGNTHSCALTSGGEVKCWGSGANGRLGNDDTANKDHPVTVVDGDGSSTALAGIVQISLGRSHTCALTSGGEVVCWGGGTSGKLGNDGSSDKDHPVTVVAGDGSTTPLSGIVQIASKGNHTCGLTSGGGVKCWGSGSNGKLGNDGSSNKDHPVSVVDGDGSSTALTGIVQIASGGDHTCGLTSEGEIKCWGKGTNGRLGNDATDNKDHPVAVVAGDGLTNKLKAGGVKNSASHITGGRSAKLRPSSRWHGKMLGQGAVNGALGNDGSTDKALSRFRLECTEGSTTYPFPVSFK